MKAGRRPVFLSQPWYELPFEKSTENFVQNTAQGSNENITSLFAVFFCVISAVFGILTFVALILYYVLIDSASWTTLQGEPGSESRTPGSLGSSGDGIVVPVIKGSMPATINITMSALVYTTVRATTTSDHVTTTPVQLTTTRAPVSTTPLLVTTKSVPVSMATVRETTAPTQVTTMPVRVPTTPVWVTTMPVRVTTRSVPLTTTTIRKTTMPIMVKTTPNQLTTTAIRLTTIPTQVTTSPVPMTNTRLRVSTTPVSVTTSSVPISMTTVRETTPRVLVTKTTVVMPTTVAKVTTTPIPETVSPSPGANTTVCMTEQCHYLAQWLRQKLNPTADPCEDFYSYVCSSFKWPGPDTFSEIDRSMKSMIIGAAYTTRVPQTRQSSWQKAAGMFQACVALVKSGRSQRDDLLNWLASVHLDLRDWTALNTIDPKDMIVRCSLDFGVHVIIAIKLYDEVFARKKRQIYMAYSESDEQWWITTRSLPQNELFEIYIHFLNLYGFHDEIAVNLAEYISLIERTIDSIALSNSATYSPVVVGSIQDMGQLTAPYITGVEWASAFAKHTNNSYLGGDSIMYTAHPLYTVAGLFETVNAGGIRFLIAWSLFRQLVPFANPTFFLNDDALTDTCYTDVQKVMKLAFAAPYLHHVTNIDAVKMATSMVRRIREAFRTALNTSSWVTGVAREVAIEKISNMQSHLGSPGQRLDPAKIDDYYDSVPDVDTERFFEAYRAALQASAHRPWKDPRTFIFDETVPNAFYRANINNLIVSATLLQHPFFNFEGPAALNYGGIGTIIAHEMMHGYDVDGINYGADGTPQEWVTPEFLEKYTERTLCLRESHKAAVERRSLEVLSERRAPIFQNRHNVL
ncbi:neprilysin-1 isoform X5 [Rhipicephalus microplus]|uniref:neprilysin-1 isoform X5 n=2 Tax=Rhipicephalus microplus TaxID=6941 RepID=UPI003F6D570E